MTSAPMTLNDIAIYEAAGNPMVQGLLKRLKASLPDSNYEDFLDAVNDDIERAIRIIEQSRQFRTEDKEDHITADIISQLKILGYSAYQDNAHGGHCDIFIDSLGQRFTWIGEAKINHSYAHIYGGFQQLADRYVMAKKGNTHGAILIYIQTANASDVMTNWETHLKTIQGNHKDIAITPCSRVALAFNSVHKDNGTNIEYTSRHLPVLLKFAPTK